MTYDPYRVQFGIVAPFWPYEGILKVAKMTEDLGFDSMWQADHTVGHLVRLEAFDIWSLYGYIAAMTKRVKLGIGVTEPHRRNPALLAQSAMTLDWVSKGRLIMGIGAGEAVNCLPFGIDMSKPVTKMEESATLVKRFWTEKFINHDGAFFHMRDASIQPFPVQRPHPPLWVAGNGPRTQAITARLGDGWIPYRLGERTYAEEIKKIHAMAQEAGRPAHSVEPGYWCIVVVDRDGDKAREVMGRIGRIAVIQSPERLKLMGYEVRKDFSLLTNIFGEGRMEELMEVAMREVPWDVVDECNISGTPDEVVGRVEKFVKAGVRHFIFVVGNPQEEYDGAIKLFAKEVMPHFREK